MPCGKSSTKTAPPSPPIRVDGSMKLVLSNAKYISSKEIVVELEMQNQSDKTIQLYERWNSWGAHQWTFNVKVAEGKTISLMNPQYVWTRNFPSIFSIPPKGSYKKTCCLFIGKSAGHHDLKKVWDFLPEGGIGIKRDLTHYFGLPVEIQAVLSPAERYETDRVEIKTVPNYFLKATSNTIVINEDAEQADDGPVGPNP